MRALQEHELISLKEDPRGSTVDYVRAVIRALDGSTNEVVLSRAEATDLKERLSSLNLQGRPEELKLLVTLQEGRDVILPGENPSQYLNLAEIGRERGDLWVLDPYSRHAAIRRFEKEILLPGESPSTIKTYRTAKATAALDQIAGPNGRINPSTINFKDLYIHALERLSLLPYREAEAAFNARIPSANLPYTPAMHQDPTGPESWFGKWPRNFTPPVGREAEAATAVRAEHGRQEVEPF